MVRHLAYEIPIQRNPLPGFGDWLRHWLTPLRSSQTPLRASSLTSLKHLAPTFKQQHVAVRRQCSFSIHDVTFRDRRLNVAGVWEEKVCHDRK